MKVLLHMCCANCAIYPVEELRMAQHEVTGFFYNHNIHPYQEYRKRLEAVRQYAEICSLPVVYRDAYLLEEFLAQVAADPAARCNYCYRSRLEETAKQAAGQGFEAFTTSLLYSRYQQHDAIASYGSQLAEQWGVAFIYDDYRRGWQQGIRTSKELGLYRQQYCGCIYSEKDRYHPRKG